MSTTDPFRRKGVAAAITAALVAFAAYAPSRIPLSNIDDYNLRRFATGYWRALASSFVSDPMNGRCRPLYWAGEGLLGLLTGSSGTVLHAGRLLFLAAAVALQVLVALRLGAGAVLSALLALATAWSFPALASWIPGGPGEALAQPFALACTLLVLRATSWRGIAAAAAVGFAACLTKESYAAWTAGALAAWAIVALLRRERALAIVAAAGAAVQFVPAAAALLLVRVWSGSYLEHVVSTISSPAGATVRAIVELSPVAVAAGLAGTVAVGARLARMRPSSWPLEDVVVLVVVGAVAAQTIAFGFVIPRYLLPMNTALALVAARGAVLLWSARRAMLLAGATAAVLAVAVAAGGVRVALMARASASEHRTDERMRQQIAQALTTDGRVRIFWVPSDVERPIGAIAHLAADGIRGDVEMRPCVPAPPGSEKLLDGLFAPYAKPVGAAQVIASTSCPGVPPPSLERVCTLALAGFEARLPRYGCFLLPEKSVLVGRW